MTYNKEIVTIVLGSTIALFGLGVFHSSAISASTFEPVLDDTANSQIVKLLAPAYSLEVPQAIGGPHEAYIDPELGLLFPNIGIIDSRYEAAPGIQIDESGIISYIVQKGDTLSDIAEKFDVSTNTIKWENDIGNTIKPDQELRILPVSGVRHKVQKGDTFASIAKEYDVEVEDITIYNDIVDTQLVVGDKLIIPNGVKKEVVAKKSSSSRSSSSSSVSVSSSRSGNFIRPTTGTVTSQFGPRKGTYHSGIDYGAPTGTPIVAAASGTVLKTSCGSGYGKCLVIQHSDGTQSLYAHASKLYVSAGTKVQQGQKIAAVGSTGRSSGPHLHFEIIEANGKKRNVNFLR